MDAIRVRKGVRMYDREAYELAMLAVEEGLGTRYAAELAGTTVRTVQRWARRGAPHARAKLAGKRRRRREEAPVDDSERAEYERAMEENVLLRAVLDDLKAAGSDPLSISNRRKCELGERLRAATGLPLREITAFLRISKSSYEYHRARLGRDRDAALRPLVREAFEAGRGRYGYRRVNAELRRRGTRVSEKRVRRVMREEGLAARGPRERRWSSYEGEPDARPANLPLRADGGHEFSAPAPGELAVTDVTEFALDGFKCYLSPVVDCFDGLPASWELSLHPDARLCVSSLRSYLDGLPDGCAPVVHTDGGGPYRSEAWKGLCEERGAVRSMSRPGRSGDNARAEGFFGALKVEFFEGRDWKGVTFPEFREELAAYMEWYAAGRLKAFDEDGATVYDTIEGRRRRLGLAA